MDNGQWSFVFPMNLEAVMIGQMRRLEEEGHKFLVVEGSQPLRCYSELPSFGSMSNHHKKAQKV